MEIDKKVLEKIAKLQALSASNHLGEVQAAEHQIKRLMDKHGITSEEIKNFHAEDQEYIQETTQLNRRRIDAKHRLIGGILQQYFFVSILWDRKATIGLIIIGQKKDIEIASYLFSYLDKAFEDEWKTYQRNNPFQNTNTSARKSFFAGVFMGLNDKLRQERQQQQQWGLVVVDNKTERAMALRKFHPTTRKAQTFTCGRSNSAYDGGKSAGANLSINMGINGGGSGNLQLS